MPVYDKITNAALNNNLEIAPSLVKLNFDFSLWKFEAPKEFDGVGSALSSARRDKAENGLPHATAQKLGALFEALIPPAPNVLKAYGQRSSEISQVSRITPQSRNQYGVFSSHAGPDATSIWAAATSGRPVAIAAHLLACYLARIWDGSEAVSIWMELIRRRKETIFTEFDRTDLIMSSALLAAKQDITRAQIAEWDASARSWLQTADSVKERQHKQLRLIIDNLNMPVNKVQDTYDSVMEAWKNSLIQMEGLIEGISQQAVGGDIILAISAWHLYPDLKVVAPSQVHVAQHDPIFASGGILTIGLETRDSQMVGISWSLPLACLRYYGDPVIKSGVVNSDERSRLTLQELLLSFLGCFLQGSGVARSNDLRTIQWLGQLADILDEAVNSNSEEAKAMIKGRAESSWFNLLLSTARAYLHSEEDERRGARRLINLGRKHGENFVGIPIYPLFGFLEYGKFVGMLVNEDEQIRFLREVAKKLQAVLRLENHQLFIRYKHRCQDSLQWNYEYATALPLPRASMKRNADESEHQSQGHSRWLCSGHKSDKRFQLAPDRLDLRFDRLGLRFERDPDTSDQEKLEHVQRDFKIRAESLRAAGEEVYERELEHVEVNWGFQLRIYWRVMQNINPEWYDSNFEEFSPYTMGYGDENTAALFFQFYDQKLFDIARCPHDDMKSMFSLFEGDRINKDAIVRHLFDYFQSRPPLKGSYLEGFKALSTAAMLYKNIPSATVDVRVLQLRFHEADWLCQAEPDLDTVDASPSKFGFDTSEKTPFSLLPYKLNRACAFSCITMFESGLHSVNPDLLRNVMAMSSGDSIYICDALLCDPSENNFSHAITRVRGNIGRPGIAYLVPPRDPLITKVKISDWPNINRDEFNGKLRNSFLNTSLHLSFTGAQSNVNLGFLGAQDEDVYMLETLISVFDKGKWIADLDPLKSFSSNQLHIIPPCEKNHNHHDTVELCQNTTSIDNWLELIDGPESCYSIVQAHGNWEARLAAVSISKALNFKTLILPRKVCWKCLEDAANLYCPCLHLKDIQSVKHIIIA